MAGINYLACIGERKKLCHSFGKAVDLLLAVFMLVQEVADMSFHSVLHTSITGSGSIFNLLLSVSIQT